MKMQNTLVFQLIFGAAKLGCILLAAACGIIVALAAIFALGSPIEMWMFKLAGCASALGALTIFDAVMLDRRCGPDDYIAFLPGGYWKRGSWWTLPRLLIYWGIVPGILFGFFAGGIYALITGEIVFLPGMTVVFATLTMIGAVAHYQIRSRISWLPFD